MFSYKIMSKIEKYFLKVCYRDCQKNLEGRMRPAGHSLAMTALYNQAKYLRPPSIVVTSLMDTVNTIIWEQVIFFCEQVMVDNLAYRDAQEGIKAFKEKAKPSWSHTDEKVH